VLAYRVAGPGFLDHPRAETKYIVRRWPAERITPPVEDATRCGMQFKRDELGEVFDCMAGHAAQSYSSIMGGVLVLGTLRAHAIDQQPGDVKREDIPSRRRSIARLAFRSDCWRR
jgi:hypothetical protein